MAAAPGGAAKKRQKKPPASVVGELTFSGGPGQWLSGDDYAEAPGVAPTAIDLGVAHVGGEVEPTGAYAMTYTQGSHGGETKTYALNEFLK